jgi:hypothetical protein
MRRAPARHEHAAAMRARPLGPTWAELGQLAVVVLSTWGASLMPGPGALDPTVRPWPTPVAVALLGLFIVAAPRRWPTLDARRRGGPLVLSLVLALIGIVAYFYLIEAWTCRYYAEVRITGGQLTPYASEYLRQDPALSCEELLKRFTGRTDEIWTPASSLPRLLLLNLTHLCAVAASAVFALLAVRLLARGRRVARAPVEALGAPRTPHTPAPGRPGAGEHILPLALALSRLVLSHETILRHAQTALRAPELVEIPSPAHARALWTAVLRRAELENAVPRLVALVLDENPDAIELTAELHAWLQGGTRSGPPASSPARAPASGASPPEARRGAGLRWGLLGLGLLVLAWLLAR